VLLVAAIGFWAYHKWKDKKEESGEA